MQTFLLQAGDIATLVTDASTTGSYAIIGDPANTATAPTLIAASTTTVLGPNIIDKRYIVDDINGVIPITITYYDLVTNLNLKAGINSPIFTGTVLGINPTYTVLPYPANGAISPVAGVARLNKTGSAGAYTLSATSVLSGVMVYLVTTTAFVHVVTSVGQFHSGVVVGGQSTLTFAPYIGANITLMCINQKWFVISKTNVTIT